MLRAAVSRLKTLNFFSSSITATNEYEVQNERISTRLLILILLITIVIVFTYTAQVRITQTIEVKQPLYNDFQLLSLFHSQTLRCSCDNVAIPHGSFISLIPQFHQVCSSVFITQQWRDYLALAAGTYLSDDFSYTGSLIFLTLSSFCNLANKTLTNALETFNSTAFISSQALSEKMFTEQVNTVTERFQSLTELAFYQSFDLVRYSIQSDSLLSGLLSNINLSYEVDSYIIHNLPRYYENHTCNCDITPSCVDLLTVQDRRTDQSNSTSYFIIPGLFKGCFLVEALRQSSLECFYQTSCISTILDFLDIPFNLSIPIIPLNPSVQSLSNISSTVDQLLSNAMTEIWQQNLSHAQYFEQCKVSLCSYLITSKFNIIYIITTLVGLVGGLTKVLRLVIPWLVKCIRRRIRPPPIIVSETVSIETRPSLLKRLWNYNYFTRLTSASNLTEIKQQIQATRLFFLLLIASFIVLISYYGSERINNLHRIESPTFEQFLHLQNNQELNSSLSCPCSTLIITYKDFLHVDYELHPICSSDFVQLKEFDQIDCEEFVPFDFRCRAPTLFYSLANLCKMSAHFIDNSLISFNTSSFIVNEALALETFILETKTIIDQFKLSTKRSYARSLAIMSKMTWSNGLMSRQETNFHFVVEWADPSETSVVILFYTVAYFLTENADDMCVCSGPMQCQQPMAVYKIINYFPYKLFDIPGLYMGCLQTESMRLSSLVCFFNQSCVDLMSLWLNISALQAMNSLELEQFNVSSIIAEMEAELLVNQWNITTSHRAFYEQCRPTQCTYTLVEHNSIWIIVTAVFGLLGGLMKMLQIFVPRLIGVIYTIYRRCRPRQEPRETVPTAVTGSPKFSFRRLYHLVRRLNFFSSSDDPSTVTERELQDQLTATRIFVFLLIFSLVILTIYASQIQVTKIVTIQHPRIDEYFSLYQSHSHTLVCPCKNINLLYQTFLTLQPTFHQVCYSDFIDDRWLNGLVYPTLYESVLSYDFRVMSTSVFGTISSLCQLSTTFLNDELTGFQTSSLISIQIIPKDQFMQQGQSLIDLFISSSKDAFVSAIRIVRDITYTNALISGFGTTVSIQPFPITDSISRFIMSSKIYNDSSLCTCSRDPTCIEPAGIYNVSTGDLLFALPGIFIGCYMVEATLQSNLAFLYDQDQIDQFRQIIKFDDYTNVPFNTTALNASHLSQYNLTTPIHMIMENVMTELWQTYVNYSAYYEQCQPVECKYTYTVKYDAIYIVTTITGLIGGLVTIYQLITLRAVKLIRWCWLKLHRSTTTVQIISLET